MYIKFYVFGVKKSKFDIIFGAQATWTRVRMRARIKKTLKCMMYIKFYVFGVKKSKSDIIFDMRAMWGRVQTSAH